MHHAPCQHGVHYAFQFAHVVLKVLCHVFYHVLWYVQTVLAYKALEDVVAELHIGCFQFGKHTPFETCEHALLHVLELYWRTVAGHDNLPSVEVQMVEDVEESLQGLFLAREFLHVVHNEAVDALIEMYEVVGLVVDACIHVLNLEKVC